MILSCPYCGTSYDIDKSLLPDGDVKVRCRKCSNIFVINAKSGLAFKAAESETSGHSRQSEDGETSAEPGSEGSQASQPDKESPFESPNELSETGEGDFKKTLIEKIDNALTEDDSAKKKESRHGKKEAGKRKPVSQPYADANSKITPLQIIILTVFFIILVAVAGCALNYLNIINLPFVPNNLNNLISNIISNISSRI